MPTGTAHRMWRPRASSFAFAEGASALGEVQPILVRLVSAFGTNAAGQILDVSPSQVSRWAHGAPVSAEMGRRIFALNEVVSRALRQFPPSVAAEWLVGSEPLLGGARPLDVLAIEGASPVMRALEGIEKGAYA